MKKEIVVFYSNKGSNKFLAQQIAANLNGEIEELKPRLNAPFFLMFGMGFGNKKLKHILSEYEKVVLCGPIWMGKLIAPLKSFIKKQSVNINKLVFVSCCGSNFEMKDKKFGHGLVFKQVKEMLQEKCIFCEAFPINLVVSDDKKEDTNAVMNTRLTEANFKGEILDIFHAFIKKV